VFGAVLKSTSRVPQSWMVYDASIQAAGFGMLLCYLLQFPTGALATSCAWRPLVFLGQISYGIYILHNFAHRFGPSLLRRITGENYFHHEVAHVAYYIALTVMAATLSHYVLEQPLRRWGRRLTRPHAINVSAPLAPRAVNAE
jgi:peptidoglycan/LPS O-acetylase OafA/YrhL